MEYNATPIGNLPHMPPQQNDPQLMSMVMQDAYADNQRPNIQPIYQPSYDPMTNTDLQQQENSFIPDFNLNALIEKFKEPIMVAVLFLFVSSETVQTLLKQNLPQLFLAEEPMKQLLIKSAIAGIGFFILRQALNNS